MKSRDIKSFLYAVAAVILLSAAIIPLRAQFITKEDEKEEKPAEGEKMSRESIYPYPPYMAFDIKADKIQGLENAVMITWGMHPDNRDDFIVARSTEIINTRERALKARTVKVVKATEKNIVIDSNLEPGMYFYAVIANSRIGQSSLELMENVNYSSTPVVIPRILNEEKAVSVTAIQAKIMGDTLALIQWEKIPGNGYTYTVYRSLNILDSIARLKKAEKVAILSDVSQYIDQGLLDAGTYYYAVTFRRLNGEENMALAAGKNFTTEGVYARGAKKESDNYRVLSIRALTRKNNIIISWDFSGKAGNRYFRLFRSRSAVSGLKQVDAQDVIEDVDITAGSYVDRGVRAGSYFYGIVPYEEATEGDFALTPGINILPIPVVVKGSAGDLKREISPVPLEHHRVIENDFHEPASSGNLEDILRKTFFAGRYKEAIKELEQVVRITDNEKERGRALLFIGRSYIELRQYQQAIPYLVKKEVTSFYPAEASFWREYATLRLQ